MHDPLISPDDDAVEENFIGLADEPWDAKTDPPLLVGLMGLPAAIIGITWSFIHG